ncbi:MAG: ABC transporter ATP-binding protein [Nitrososphaerota archaeon]
MSRGEVILVERLVKRYADGGEVGPISLRVGKGDVYGFVGPNGSGKTTTLRAVLGLLKPTSGRVEVFAMNPWREAKRVNSLLGYSPELPNFPAFLSARQVLEVTGKLRGLRGEDLKREVERVLDLTGLVNHADRRVGNFSKGMVQRLSIGQALIGDPELLVLDEPMLGVDPVGRVQIREVLREVSRTGKTVVFSSHELYEVERLATRVGMVYLGKTVMEGGIDEILNGAGGLRVRVVTRVAPGDGVVEAIRRIEGVRDVRVEGNSLTVFSDNSTDVRDAIAERIVLSGCGLLELRTERPSLEEVFMERVRTVGRG